MLADAGKHVLELPPVGVMIEHIIDRNERHARCMRQAGALREPRTVIAAIKHAGCNSHAPGRGFAQKREDIACFRKWFFLGIGGQAEFCR